MDHRRYNRREHLKIKLQAEKVIEKSIKKNLNGFSSQLQEALAKKGLDLSERGRKEMGFEKIQTSLLPNLSEANIQSHPEYFKKHLDDKFSNTVFSNESNFQLSANCQVL